MDSAASAMVMVVLRWCPLRHSSLRTHFLYDYSYGKMLGTIICGPERYWKKIKNTHSTEWHGAALQGEDILKANIYK